MWNFPIKTCGICRYYSGLGSILWTLGNLRFSPQSVTHGLLPVYGQLCALSWKKSPHFWSEGRCCKNITTSNFSRTCLKHKIKGGCLHCQFFLKKKKKKKVLFWRKEAKWKCNFDVTDVMLGHINQSMHCCMYTGILIFINHVNSLVGILSFYE